GAEHAGAVADGDAHAGIGGGAARVGADAGRVGDSEVRLLGDARLAVHVPDHEAGGEGAPATLSGDGGDDGVALVPQGVLRGEVGKVRGQVGNHRAGDADVGGAAAARHDHQIDVEPQ